ncbi:MAG: hypothetical protein KAQ63_01780 [Candidatus Moranbacteria bacterium]|nr:hypothetical protein [Candidatus Moranbacteria bacterium]
MDYNPILLERIKSKLPRIINNKTAIPIGMEEVERYEKAKQIFEGMLAEKGGEKLVQGIFRLHDELTVEYRKDHVLACRKGCDYCCHQLVCCSAAEMGLIVNFFKNLPRERRRRISRGIKKKAWKFYGENKKVIEGSSRWEMLDNFLRSKLLGVPCIYLSKQGQCLIYPVRPIDCRVAKTESPCGDSRKIEGLPNEIRLFCDQIASDLIMEGEKEKFGEMEIAPLIGWPISQQFGSFFK